MLLTTGLLLVDVFVIGRRPHTPTTRELALHLSGYIGLAVVFGLGVWTLAGAQYGAEFYAGWLTEYSLSVDNLFIFIIIMAKLNVPREYQQTALLVGIVIALVMRGIFIAVGAAAIENFSWVFYLFGALPGLHRGAARSGQRPGRRALRRAAHRQVRPEPPLGQSTEWHGVKLSVKENGKRLLTPMFIVVLSLGMTDLLFALDSIPAIYGLTSEPYLVFTANVFALMGLRQLYFLIGDLLQRLVYLSYGLAFLLLFIGVKLIMEALHLNELGFINGGEHVEWAPEIPIWLSLLVIVGTLAITTVASLAKDRSTRRREEELDDTVAGETKATE